MLESPSCEEELALVSSIKSTNIEKIIFTTSAEPWRRVKDVFWEELCSTLTRLAKGLTHGNKLELELRGGWKDVLVKGANRICQESSLPSICRVTVRDVQNNLIYSSDGFK